MSKTDFYLDPANLPKVEEASEYLTGARRAYKGAIRANENATDRAAYATFLGEHVLKVIFQPRGTEGAMTGLQWAETFGKKSKTMTTGWKVLGHALMVVGLDPEGDTYKRLRNSNAYVYGDMSAAILKDGATEESILPVLAVYADEFGNRIGKKRGPVLKDGGSDGDVTTSDQSASDGGTTVPASVQVLSAVGIVEQFCSDESISLDEWADITSRLEAAIAQGNTDRAKVAATPRPTAPKAAKKTA